MVCVWTQPFPPSNAKDDRWRGGGGRCSPVLADSALFTPDASFYMPLGSIVSPPTFQPGTLRAIPSLLPLRLRGLCVRARARIET